jgi:hypothetical protein
VSKIYTHLALINQKKLKVNKKTTNEKLASMFYLA